MFYLDFRVRDGDVLGSVGARSLVWCGVSLLRIRIWVRITVRITVRWVSRWVRASWVRASS